MRILLLASAFNGLTQRIWDELRSREHHVTVELSLSPEAIIEAAHGSQPDLIICPFLKERVPAEVWRKWPTVIIHPGPVGDQGPSSLDRAIMTGAPEWGVTALQAHEEFDAGPIWAYETFPVPTETPIAKAPLSSENGNGPRPLPLRKSALYNGAVTEAAVACTLKVIENAGNPDFQPTPLKDAPRPIADTASYPLLKQAERRFDWSDDATDIVRKIRAADGFPGVRTLLNDTEVNAFDATTSSYSTDTTPGRVIGQRGGHLLVAAGRGSVWIGQLKLPGGIKLPATTVLPVDVPRMTDGPREIRYRKRGPVGEVSFSFYNGAAGTSQCLRLTAALRYAADQNTRVLVLRGGGEAFCNGIHLNEIEAAIDPAETAWANIQAINETCRTLLETTHQLTIAAFTGNAGAGGVMMALGADVIAARKGVILNPYYNIGLYGSELHTLTLSRRVGAETAEELLAGKLPIGVERAVHIGLVDLVGPGDATEFSSWLESLADRYAEPGAWRNVIEARQPMSRPAGYYEARELAEMAADMFDDRSGFAAARDAFVHKRRPDRTPAHLTGRP